MSRPSDLNIPAIYTITCSANGKVYVGQTINARKRWSSHRWHLARGRHRNVHLQRAWTKYGTDAFAFSVVRRFDGISADDLPAALGAAELEVLSAHPRCFNLNEAGEERMEVSAETRARLSEERQARWADESYRVRLRASHRAKHSDPEWAANRNAALKAATDTDEYRARRSEISKAMWADGGILRETQSEVRRKNWEDPAYREKQKVARVTAWEDEDVRERRRAGMRAAWADPEKAARRVAAIKAAYAAKPNLRRIAVELLRTKHPQSVDRTDLWCSAVAALPKEPSAAVCGATLSNLVRDGIAERTETGWRWKP